MQETSLERGATSLVTSNIGSAEDSCLQNSVISSNSQSTSLHSPYATRKRLSSSCLSNGSCTTVNEDSAPNPRQTRVNTTNTTERETLDSTQNVEKNFELESQSFTEISDLSENQNKRKRKCSDSNDSSNKRRRQESEPSEVDNSRKRRTELDKLLDAGSSSFHFETAKATAERLGPIHIDVDDEKQNSRKYSDEEESLSEAERRRPVGWLTIPSKKKKNPKDNRCSPKKQRLLKKVSPGNAAAKSPSQSKITEFFTKTTEKNVLSPKSIPPPPKRNRGKFRFKKQEIEESEDESDSNETSSQVSYVASNILEAIEKELALVDGCEVPVDSLRFSFENTPAREGWFQTYTRQDQGDEILYYPEPKSFPLPYEMPVSTFYPRRDKGDNPESGKTKSKGLNSKSSSRNTSVNPSGTVTPISYSQPALKDLDMEVLKAKGKVNSLSTALAASNRLNEALTGSRKTRGGKNESTLSAISQLNHLERKSPRGHASTKSLISATLGGFQSENTLELAENFDISNPVINEDNIRSPKMPEDLEMEYKTNDDPKLRIDLQLPREHDIIDEGSNDSWATSECGIDKTGRVKNPIPMQEEMYKEMSLELDSYFFDGELSMLDGTINPPAPSNPSIHSFIPLENSSVSDNSVRQSRQRQRSSGSNHSTDKPIKIHKHHKHKNDKNRHRNRSEQMDHVVTSNVDQVLLDCLEDELPGGIVAIEGEIPGSSPLELLSNFEGCDSMIYARSSRRWSKPRPFQEHSSTDRKSELRAVFGGRGMGYLSPTRLKPDEFDNDDNKYQMQHLATESTILKRLLTDGLPTMNGSNHVCKIANPKVVSDGIMLPPPPVNAEGEEYSSSEETASVCSSSVTTTSQSSDASGPSKRKKKRNLTGFPSPKKKRKQITTDAPPLRKPAGKAPRVKLLTAVLTQNAKKAAKAKKNLKLRSPGRRGKESKGAECKTGRWKKSSLRSSRQERISDIEGAESDISDSDEDASDSELESSTISRRGRPPIQGNKKTSAKPKKAIKMAKRSPTEWQQAKALANERALSVNKSRVKNVRPKKIVVSRKAYAEYKKARLAEAAAEAAAASKTKRLSPNKSLKSSNGGMKSKKSKKSPASSSVRNNEDNLELELEASNLETEKEGEEESVLADAEDEESEDECDEQKETRPPGWLTVPKKKLAASKKNNQQKKGSRSGRIALKKPKLRNSTLRTKQTSSVPNKSCRLT